MNIQTYTNVFAGAGTVRYEMAADYLVLMETSDDVTVSLYNLGSRMGRAEDVVKGFSLAVPEGFTAIEITSATAQTVRFAVSQGVGIGVDFVASLNIGGQAGTVTDAAPVSVGVAATLLLAADSTRKAARFTNKGTAIVYLGGAGVTTANGAVEIAPGESWYESEAAPAAWYGISGTAGQSVRIQGAA